MGDIQACKNPQWQRLHRNHWSGERVKKKKETGKGKGARYLSAENRALLFNAPHALADKGGGLSKVLTGEGRKEPQRGKEGGRSKGRAGERGFQVHNHWPARFKIDLGGPEWTGRGPSIEVQ